MMLAMPMIYVPAVLSYQHDDDDGKDTAANLLYLSLSTNYKYVCELRNRLTADESTRLYYLLLLVTDQISGMTDSHAMTVYKTITAT